MVDAVLTITLQKVMMIQNVRDGPDDECSHIMLLADDDDHHDFVDDYDFRYKKCIFTCRVL